MKLDRNENEDGAGKFALLDMRKLRLYESGETFSRYSPRIDEALRVLDSEGLIQWGVVGAPDEFFAIKLKDIHSTPALFAYAESIESDDPEFSAEVREMAMRSGAHSPLCKRPD